MIGKWDQEQIEIQHRMTREAEKCNGWKYTMKIDAEFAR